MVGIDWFFNIVFFFCFFILFCFVFCFVFFLIKVGEYVHVIWVEIQYSITFILSNSQDVQMIRWGCAANMGSKISLMVYQWPLFCANFGIWKGKFSKFSHTWAKSGLNLWQFEKKMVILVKIWPEIGPVCVWMCKLVYLWVHFKFPASCPYQNQRWVLPEIDLQHKILAQMLKKKEMGTSVVSIAF